MAVTAYWYGLAFTSLGNKEIDFDDGNVKVALVMDHVYDRDADDYWDDVSTDETSGTGYTAGGSALQNGTMAYATATHVWNFDADDPVWASSSISATGAVYYYNTGTPATSPLISYVDFGGTETSSSGNFTITHHADGITKVTGS